MREDADTTKANAIDIGRIMEMIPHRYPFLLVDRVEDIVSGASAVGIKNITINELDNIIRSMIADKIIYRVNNIQILTAGAKSKTFGVAEHWFKGELELVKYIKKRFNESKGSWVRITSKEKNEAETLYREAISIIDNLTSKKILHKNTAARRKSSLTKHVNSLS